jgi:acylphosphatase
MDKDPNEIVRVHLWAKGRVQGVGFRAHVEYYALHMGALGWVRNVGNDTVEAVAEGPRELVERFITMVREGPRLSHVEELKIEWEQPTGEFAGFVVKHNI